MRLSLLAVLALLLTACAAPAVKLPDSPGWSSHSAALQGLDNWQAEGKLALRSSEHSESASLLWTQRNGESLLRLSGPMGLNTTTIRSDGQRLQVQRGDDIRDWDISTPEAIARNTGWDLPLQALPHWLKGLPAPQGRIEGLQLEQDRLQLLTQDGWEVSYEAYGAFGQLVLPTRLRIQRGDTTARVIIRNWNTLPG